MGGGLSLVKLPDVSQYSVIEAVLRQDTGANGANRVDGVNGRQDD